jgi:hypothetical protein
MLSLAEVSGVLNDFGSFFIQINVFLTLDHPIDWASHRFIVTFLSFLILFFSCFFFFFFCNYLFVIFSFEYLLSFPFFLHSLTYPINPSKKICFPLQFEVLHCCFNDFFCENFIRRLIRVQLALVFILPSGLHVG